MTRALSRSGALALALALLATPALSQDFFSDLFGGFMGRPSRSWGGERDDGGRRQRRPRRIEKPKIVAPKPATAPAGDQAKPDKETPPAPYDAQVQRLAEILGGLSYLRDLCGDGDGADWRAKMAKLRDADTPTGSRRAKLTAAFNRGFSGYELTYHSCTPNAKLVIARYLEEAQQVASNVATRYGTP